MTAGTSVPKRFLSREFLLPLTAFLFIAAGVFALWWEIQSGENQRLQIETEVTAEQVRLRLESWIDARTGVIRHMADKWPQQHQSRPEAFRADASRFLELYPGFQALNWIDEHWVIRIIVPGKGNEPALNSDLHHHPSPGVSAAIERALARSSICRTPVIELLQGGKGFATYCPVFADGHRLKGFVNGVFRTGMLVEGCLPEKNLRERFRFDLHEESGEPIYKHGFEKYPHRWPHQVDLPVRIVDRPWRLEIAPSPLFLAQARTTADEWLLAAGLVLAFVVSWLLHVLLFRHRALRDSREQLSMLLDNAPAVMMLVDRERRVRRINRAAALLTGRPAEEMIGLRDGDALRCAEARTAPEGCGSGPACTTCAIFSTIKDTLQTGTPHYRVEGSRNLILDGRERMVHFLLSTAPIRFTDEDMVLVYLEDITERKKAEEARRNLEAQVLQMQKLESLGLMAGGIAHDFSNILMAVLGNADLALEELPPASPARENLVEIEEAARRAAELCRQMLAYSGKGCFEIMALDLSQIVEEIAHMLRVTIPKKIVIRYHFAGDFPLVEADPGQMRQVIMNLIINAAESIGDRNGEITVSTGSVECGPGELKDPLTDHVLPAGRFVFFEVADTGCGMDPETREKIFDPFFTTKFTGRGMGLAAVLGIVRGHKGTLTVRSRPGKGSCFRVFFPASDRAKPPREPEEIKKRKEKKDGTVLIVDDEESVRAVAARMLERAGFAVMTAQDGREAVELFLKHREEISVVLLDLTMPHMDGEETFRELRRINEEVPILFSSGYNEQDVMERFSEGAPVGFIQKPYDSRELIEKCDRVVKREFWS